MVPSPPRLQERLKQQHLMRRLQLTYDHEQPLGARGRLLACLHGAA